MKYREGSRAILLAVMICAAIDTAAADNVSISFLMSRALLSRDNLRDARSVLYVPISLALCRLVSLSPLIFLRDAYSFFDVLLSDACYRDGITRLRQHSIDFDAIV
jgi:hypothetical protein